MSVQEVYDRLDQCDRLESERNAALARYDELVDRVRKAIFSIHNTAKVYTACAADPEIDACDMYEFYGRISGLNEANKLLRQAIIGSEDESEE